MKNFMVRLSDEVHETIRDMAAARGISVADVIRQSLEVYVIGAEYAREGKRLVWEKRDSSEKVEVLIPGFNVLQRSKKLTA